jgi:hypothetical protein
MIVSINADSLVSIYLIRRGGLTILSSLEILESEEKSQSQEDNYFIDQEA